MIDSRSLSTPMPASPSAGPDARSLDALRTQAGRDPRAAARQVAVQFEAHFMETVFKGLREAMAPAGGGEGGQGQAVFTGMLDSQFARQFAGRPGGLAQMIEQQLARQMTTMPASAATAGTPTAMPAMPPKPASWRAAASPGATASAPAASAATDATPAAASAPRARGASDFLRRMLPHAQAAEQATGVPASFILGQAALESGWGRGEIRHADGRPSFNLFGIKAGGRWRGEVAVTGTTEFEGGQAQRQQAQFRSYGSYAQAFTDYARLLAGSPRYAQALREGGSPEGFASALQRAGYATDPRYADKLARTIHQTLALQRAATGPTLAPQAQA